MVRCIFFPKFDLGSAGSAVGVGDWCFGGDAFWRARGKPPSRCAPLVVLPDRADPPRVAPPTRQSLAV